MSAPPARLARFFASESLARFARLTSRVSRFTRPLRSPPSLARFARLTSRAFRASPARFDRLRHSLSLALAPRSDTGVQGNLSVFRGLVHLKRLELVGLHNITGSLVSFTRDHKVLPGYTTARTGFVSARTRERFRRRNHR